MFKCVTKELKKKIFKGLDKIDSRFDDILDNRMEYKMELLKVILLYAEGLTNIEICKELGKSIPLINRRIFDAKNLLDKETLKEVEDLHNNNLGIKPTTTLEKVLATVETYDGYEHLFEKEEMLSVLALYSLGHDAEDIKVRLPMLDYKAIENYLGYIKHVLTSEFLEIEYLYLLNRGLREYFKDSYIAMHKQENALIESEKILEKYFKELVLTDKK